MKKYLSMFVYAILAGFAIGLGGTVFLRLKDAFVGGSVVGAFFFSVGLLTVCTRGYNLYTGKACYLFDNKIHYIFDLVVIWVGNLIGNMFLGWILNMTTLCNETGINKIAETMCMAKLSSPYLSLFVLGFICNIFIFIAVNGYAKNPHEIGKYFMILFGVTCFIVVGSEHCVADMYYFSVSNVLYTHFTEVMPALFVITIGNLCGGVFFPLLEKLAEKLKAE